MTREREGARFRWICESAPVAFALNDDSQNITYLNPEFVKLFGYTPEDIPTLERWWPLAYPDPTYRAWVASEWAARLARSQATGAAFEPMELTIQTKTGSNRTVLAYARLGEESPGGEHLVVLYDITELRHSERERRLLEQQLAHAQRTEALGRLAGGVAHDNNNLLAVIAGNLELAKESLEPGDPLLEYVEESLSAARRAAQLTRQLLTYARREHAAPEQIDVKQEVENGLRMLRPLLGPRVNVHCNVADNLWPVCVDPTQFHQVLANLCMNARDAIRREGPITVELANATLRSEDPIQRWSAEADDYVRLRVVDGGGGMSEEVRARAFEPFFTTKPAGEGTGLGLSTVHGIARQYGGFATIESTEGEGTTVSVYFPRQSGDVRPPSVRARRPSTSGRETVLVVDDEPGLLRLASMLLERRGYRTLQATSAAEAVRVSATYPGEIHALLCDVIMPGGNGLDVARALRSSRPGVRCLFMSGYTADALLGSEPGEFPYLLLEKPFSATLLEKRLRDVLDDAGSPAR